MPQAALETEAPVLTNGVNVTALFDTIAAVKQDPELAGFRFRAENRWIEGSVNRSSVQGFYGRREEDATRRAPFILDADEPLPLLGEDKAPNPVEFVLHALASCLTTSMVYHAAAQDIEIQGIESKLEGDMDLRGFLGLSDQVRKGFQSVRVRMRVRTEATAEKLRELAMHSPVFDIVSKSLPVELAIDTY